MSEGDPRHEANAPLLAGDPLGEARAALVLLHGRGGDPEGILPLANAVGVRPGSGWAILAPRASGGSWYPRSFLSPLAENAAGVESGLRAIDACLDRLADAGIPPERVVLAGFSQGACLASEHAARRPRRCGGVAALTGGLIGPSGFAEQDLPYAGDLEGTPVFLGASDPDAHVPFERVELTARTLERLGAAVTLERYPNRPHTILREHAEGLRRLLDGVEAAPAG